MKRDERLSKQAFPTPSTPAVPALHSSAEVSYPEMSRPQHLTDPRWVSSQRVALSSNCMPFLGGTPGKGLVSVLPSDTLSDITPGFFTDLLWQVLVRLSSRWNLKRGR